MHLADGTASSSAARLRIHLRSWTCVVEGARGGNGSAKEMISQCGRGSDGVAFAGARKGAGIKGGDGGVSGGMCSIRAPARCPGGPCRWA